MTLLRDDEQGARLQLPDAAPALAATQVSINEQIRLIKGLAAGGAEGSGFIEDEASVLQRLLFNLSHQGIRQVEVEFEIPGDEAYRARRLAADDYSDEAEALREEREMVALLRMQLAAQGVADTGQAMRTTVRVEPPTIDRPTIIADEMYGRQTLPLLGVLPELQGMDHSATGYAIPLKFVREVRLHAKPTQPNSPAPIMPARPMY